jgi:undecaprenyl diphosphate synthase
MDGNGRWAKKRHLPRIAGHHAGYKVVRELVEYAAKRGISALTLFAFSQENRARPAEEVSALMALFLEALNRYVQDLNESNVRLRLIGDRNHLSEKLCEQMRAAEKLTENNTGMTLVVAIDYSGRWDIMHAVTALAAQVAHQEITVDKITPAVFSKNLCLSDLPEPDLLIRTSGEQRLSNFLLWQLAYTEIYFTPVLWPDFSPATLEEAIVFFKTRERRFGLTSEQIVN